MAKMQGGKSVGMMKGSPTPKSKGAGMMKGPMPKQACVQNMPGGKKGSSK